MEGVCLDPLVQRAQKLGWGRTDGPELSEWPWEGQGAPTQKLWAAALTHPCLDCSAACFPLANRWRPPDRGSWPRPPSAVGCCVLPGGLFGLERENKNRQPVEVALLEGQTVDHSGAGEGKLHPKAVARTLDLTAGTQKHAGHAQLLSLQVNQSILSFYGSFRNPDPVENAAAITETQIRGNRGPNSGRVLCSEFLLERPGGSHTCGPLMCAPMHTAHLA
ncbi:uncharacterized protein [Symphalangus syndactylus]|uniref:uncharacterized protein isoform X9 n=1 Tax=Symphalangus syndactylus TaxID=9590 RepID=UPI003005DF6F